MFKLNAGAFCTVIISKIFPPLGPWAWARFSKMLYPYISLADKEGRLTLMNYGYAYHPGEKAPVLDDVQEKNKYSIQLYHKVATGVDLTDQTVLEVGSGRGGGAAALHELLDIDRFFGVELCREAVDFCNSHYKVDGLSFVEGNAEELPFDEDSFDAVINVESSHCYPHMRKFLEEVVRVVCPGGHFLFTDFREPREWGDLKSLMAEVGMEIVREEDITDRVVEALDRDSGRKVKLIEQLVPKSTRSFFKSFAAVEGSDMYQAFKKKELEYKYFVARISE